MTSKKVDKNDACRLHLSKVKSPKIEPDLYIVKNK